jgi:hypothetical protein
MMLRYALMAAAAFAAAGAAEVRAQSPFPPAGAEQRSPFPPVGQQSPFPPVGQPSPFPQQKPPCYDEFTPLRQEVDKRFQAAKAALDRRGTAAELCTLLTQFTQAESSLVKFVQQNAATCMFPPNMLETVKASHVKSEGYRKQACTAAAAPARPARPAEPTLSDSLAPPAVNKDTTRTGRGTFDSLGGNPLAR